MINISVCSSLEWVGPVGPHAVSHFLPRWFCTLPWACVVDCAHPGEQRWAGALASTGSGREAAGSWGEEPVSFGKRLEQGPAGGVGSAQKAPGLQADCPGPFAKPFRPVSDVLTTTEACCRLTPEEAPLCLVSR